MSTITIDFPDIRESDSAAYAYLANVYDSTCAHNQAACHAQGSPPPVDET